LKCFAYEDAIARFFFIRYKRTYTFNKNIDNTDRQFIAKQSTKPPRKSRGETIEERQNTRALLIEDVAHVLAK